MKTGNLTKSAVKPETAFEIKKLNEQTTEISYVENVSEVAVTDEEGERTEYEYTLYLGSTSAQTYDDIVSALVGLKFTSGDEIALMRKGMTDSTNEEYTAYVEYVENCKVYARTKYSN